MSKHSYTCAAGERPNSQSINRPWKFEYGCAAKDDLCKCPGRTLANLTLTGSQPDLKASELGTYKLI